MIFESITIVGLALLIDLTFGDPKNKFHPTAWIGNLIAKLTPYCKNQKDSLEKINGIILVSIVVSIVLSLIIFFTLTIYQISIDWIQIIIFVTLSSLLLKSTFAIKGMEKYALSVIASLKNNDLVNARNNLSKIVKRDTKNLDQNHIISGVLESISENTVDGITGPLFYYALFGLPGAFLHRVVNTCDSMLGYKTKLFRNLGWFSAKSDSVLNFIPSRLTGFLMIISAAILKNNWKKSYEVMFRDAKNTESLNAGYPMAALAGALDTRFEKLSHYELGDGDVMLNENHVHSAISIMKLTSFLFFLLVTIPIITILNLIGWWFHV